MSTLFKIVILFLFLGAIFFGGASIRAPFLSVKNFIFSVPSIEALTKVNLENQSLKAEIIRLSLGLKLSDARLLSAKVYSIYPFNDKSLVTIAVGVHDKVKVGDIVLAGRNIFFGQIKNIGDSWSEVETIFDISKNISVRIGVKGTPALLVGGPNPSLSMIDKSAEVANGDPIYLASRDLPYGLVVGNLGNLKEQNVSAFKGGDVVVPYSLRNLEEVLVALKPAQ